jgi:hypothetical protein
MPDPRRNELARVLAKIDRGAAETTELLQYPANRKLRPRLKRLLAMFRRSRVEAESMLKDDGK